jgi:hypothetical protein
MKLDRNTNPDGHGKYAIIKLREHNISEAIKSPGIQGVMVAASAIDLGDTPETEFFVIRLKDKYAANALHAYSASCRTDDPEFSREVQNLALRAAKFQPKQMPT